MKLFTTGFLQIFFVAVNTVLITKGYYIAVFLCSFIISIIWSSNVKSIAFSDMTERFIYAFGAAIGGTSGMYLTIRLAA